MLTMIPDMLAAVGTDPADPAGPRMSPTAYPDDPLASVEYEMGAGEVLGEARSADRDVFLRTLAEATVGVALSLDEAAAWMRVVGDARLTLAARLGIEDDAWHEQIDESPYAFLHYLTFIQSALIGALTNALEEP